MSRYLHVQGKVNRFYSQQAALHPMQSLFQAYQHEHTWVQDSVLVGDVVTQVPLGRRSIVVRGQQVAHGFQSAQGRQWLANNTGGRVGHFFAMNYRFASGALRRSARPRVRLADEGLPAPCIAAKATPRETLTCA